MPDNWGFVLAAYGVTTVVLGLYWRRLVRKEKDLVGRPRAHTERAPQASTAEHSIAERSRQPSSSGHPRPDPSTRGPLQ